jgi:hypothetical protein
MHYPTTAQHVTETRRHIGADVRVRNSRRRLAASVVGVYALMLFGSTHWPKLLLPHLPMFFSFDKLCHFSGYAVLTLLLLLMPVGLFRMPEGGYRSPAWLAALLVLLAVAAAAALDELTQPLVLRDLDPLDWAFDITGAIAALTAVAIRIGYRAACDWVARDQAPYWRIR